MVKPKNIIFDYGAVIFDIDHQRTIKAFRKLGLQNIDHIFGHLNQNRLFDRFEKGEISPAEFRTELKKGILAGIEDEQIDEAWNAMLIGVPEPNFALLMQAKAPFRTFLLSNNNEIHYRWIENYLKKVWGIENMMANFFEKDYYSHLMGMRKPDAEIFLFVLQKHNLIPEETLFVDDSPQHIATAKSLGIQTYFMEKGKCLRDFFKETQLLQDL